MFNAEDLFLSLVIGLAAPLALLDGIKALAGTGMPAQHDGFQFETRLSPWLLAILAGPALLVERLAEAWRARMLDGGELAAGVFIVLGWATIYGYCLLRGVQFLIPQ